jgi:hypothetical protein
MDLHHLYVMDVRHLVILLWGIIPPLIGIFALGVREGRRRQRVEDAADARHAR